MAKLVRDNIPDIIRANGDEPVTKVLLDDAEFQRALKAKLQEECEEAVDADAGDLPSELADVLEVVRALAALSGLSWLEIEALAERKRAERGAFEKRLWLEDVVRLDA